LKVSKQIDNFRQKYKFENIHFNISCNWKTFKNIFFNILY
jgi:hypothetical protein